MTSRQTEAPYWDITRKVIGAAFEVHKTLGPGFLEKVYVNSLVTELAEAGTISPAHEAQLLNYLKATGIKVGLLLNFGSKSVEVKRMVL